MITLVLYLRWSWRIKVKDNVNDIIEYTSKLNLLYVEDNDEARETSMFIFEEFFKKITIAVDGEDGFEKFKNEPDIDIIITDINMPHLNGLEMIEKIRDIDANIPVLILSAYNEINFFMDSIKLDVEGYLLKPIEMNQLLSTLNKVVQKIILKEKADENLNLLHQYQEATDVSSIVSKTDKDGNITYVNDEFCKITGYDRDELIGKNHNILKSNDKSVEFYKQFWDTIKNKKQIWQGVFRNIDKNGQPFYVKLTVKPIVDKNENIIEFIALMDDITDIMNPVKQFHDLVESFDESMVIFIQIEDFKNIDRYYGQILAMGIEERFLEVINEFLPSYFQNDRVFSLGFGKYAIAKPIDTFTQDRDECVKSLKKFQADIDNYLLNIDGMAYDLSILISLAYGNDALENANYGLSELKYSHTSFIIATNFSKKVHDEAEHNIKILKMIKTALSNNKIVSYFQPIINNDTKEIEKYESLVRLVDEGGKVYSPFFFLDVAKNGKYYSQITHRVLENSFDALNKTDKSISINLSSIDIEKKHTREKIIELLKTHASDTNRIVFELLEDEEIKDFESFKAFIVYVKNLGVKIAIDDFGSGYSNFERLMDYEPDILKIDGSLIKNIVEDKYSLSLVETIVSFAKKQGIKTLAEYVENEEIYLILKDLGVDYSQGYFFGKPDILK
jgi:PAS domain S-box-containing protein